MDAGKLPQLPKKYPVIGAKLAMQDVEMGLGVLHELLDTAHDEMEGILESLERYQNAIKQIMEDLDKETRG